jgi:hypothetical protein
MKSITLDQMMTRHFLVIPIQMLPCTTRVITGGLGAVLQSLQANAGILG